MTAAPRIVSCEVLRNEIEAVVEHDGRGLEVDFVDGALHDYPDKLRAALQERIDATPGDCDIYLSCARCSNGTVGLKGGEHRLVLPAADDCISLLLGSRMVPPAASARCPPPEEGLPIMSVGGKRASSVPSSRTSEIDVSRPSAEAP